MASHKHPPPPTRFAAIAAQPSAVQRKPGIAPPPTRFGSGALQPKAWPQRAPRPDAIMIAPAISRRTATIQAAALATSGPVIPAPELKIPAKSTGAPTILGLVERYESEAELLGRGGDASWAVKFEPKFKKEYDTSKKLQKTLTKKQFTDRMYTAFRRGLTQSREADASSSVAVALDAKALHALGVSVSKPATAEEKAPVVVDEKAIAAKAELKRLRKITETVDAILKTVKDAIGRWDVFTVEENAGRAGCVKAGPSYSVDADIRKAVYNRIRKMEGTDFHGGKLHIVPKAGAAGYNLTLHGAYRADNPKTMVNLHIA